MLPPQRQDSLRLNQSSSEVADSWAVLEAAGREREEWWVSVERLVGVVLP